jgi:3',5'-cyclic AMP phosphodiesterase CpdA
VSQPWQSLYERVAHRGGFAALAQQPPPSELEALGWLIGRWREDTEVFPTPTAPGFARQAVHVIVCRPVLDGHWLRLVRDPDDGWMYNITYDPYDGQWVRFDMDSHAMRFEMTGVCSDADHWVFESHCRLFDEPCVLRARLIRLDEDRWRWAYDERRPDGAWLPIDRHTYSRLP